METFYEVRCRYEKIDDEGNPKKVTELYLSDAVSCMDAETIVTQEVQPFSNGEFNVTNVRKTNIAELFERNLEGLWYACRVAMVVEEKRVPVLIYVKAADVKDAESFVVGELKKGMAEWIVVSITETKVMDVFFK